MNNKPCKHKFEPRYDKEYTTPFTEMMVHGYQAKKLYDTVNIPYLKKCTYVHDICKKCGKIIKK